MAAKKKTVRKKTTKKAAPKKTVAKKAPAKKAPVKKATAKKAAPVAAPETPAPAAPAAPPADKSWSRVEKPPASVLKAQAEKEAKDKAAAKARAAAKAAAKVAAAAAKPKAKPVIIKAAPPAPPVKAASSGSSTASWWQYARWVWLIARNSRITEPTGTELAAVKTFLKLIWNPQTQTGSRPWLGDKFNRLSVSGAASNYLGDIDVEPTHVLIEMLGVVGRDLDDIPITDSEKAWVDTLIAATGNRRYGTGTEFGGVGGSNVTIP